MNKACLHIALVSLLIFLSQPCLLSQESLYNFEEEIKNISINEDGRLQILGSSKLCALEGNQLVDACITLPQEASHVLPITDDFLVLSTNNILHFIREEIFVDSDSFPELITGIIQVDSVLFIGTAGQGLFRYSLNSHTKKFIGFADQFINDFCQVNDQLCLALDDGIALYNLSTGTIKHKKLNDIISFIEPLMDNQFIAASETGHLFILNIEAELELEKSIDNIKINDLSASLDKVFLLDGNTCYQIDKDLEIKPFAKGAFRAFLALPNVLLVAEGRELLFFDINVQATETNFPVYSIFSENEDLFWLGSEGEVQHWYKDSLLAKIKIPTRVEHLSVSALLVKDHIVYAGTLGDGLFIFNSSGQLLKHILSQHENNKNNIIQIREKEGLIWVAYLNGLLTIEPSKYKQVKDYGQILGNNYLYCFLPLKQDEFYIGTSSNGLLKYAGNKISYLLPKQSVLSIFKQGDSLYFSTENEGLFLMTENESISPLSSINNIQCINVFDDCLFWAEDGGNMIMDINKKLKYPVGNGGLKGIQLNAVSQTKSAILLGYENGFLKLNKASLMQLKHFGLHLNTPRLFNKKIAPDAHSFRHHENAFTFTFHPNIYSGTSNTLYKYRLLGLDSTWQSTQQNKLSYFNLNPGKYEFQVGGGLQTNFDTENVQSYIFAIAKPYWTSWWFLGLLAIVLLVLLYLYIKWRERNIISKQKQEQQRIIFEFEQLKNQIDPHFLFNSLNSLIGLIEENPSSAARSAEKLSQLYRNILKFEKIDLIPLNTEIELAKDYFEIHKLRYEDLIELKIDKTNGAEGMIIPLSSQFLIENAIKHNIINSQHHLTITIEFSADYLTVCNTKNKKHLPEHKLSGIGLANLKARYKFITEKPVLIEETDSIFKVKIPIVHG